MIGSACYVVIGIVGSIVMPMYVKARTTDVTQKSTNEWMACSLWWLAICCMWLMWACVFMFGMNPMLNPTYSPTG